MSVHPQNINFFIEELLDGLLQKLLRNPVAPRKLEFVFLGFIDTDARRLIRNSIWYPDLILGTGFQLIHDFFAGLVTIYSSLLCSM